MMKTPYIFAPLALLVLLSGCFKDEPKRKTFMAAGPWKVENVNIQQLDSLGNVTSETDIESVGMLMLTHDDNFQYQDTYSYSLDADKLATSSIYSFFNAANIWGLGATANVFNLGSMDPETGYVSRIATFTMLKLKKHTMEFQYVSVSANGTLNYVEVWTLKKGTH